MKTLLPALLLSATLAQPTLAQAEASAPAEEASVVGDGEGDAAPSVPPVGDTLRDAIERGVPLFNAGDAAGCAATYAQAVRELLARPGALGELHAADLRATLDASVAADDATAGAWVLRGAMDRLLEDLAFVPRSEAPLPQGYPGPGPVGRIVTKSYPAYRAARVEGGENAFWPLFNHIKRNDVQMTAPVEMTMDGELAAVDMSFLYERPDQGQAGARDGVAVVNLPALTVLSVGMRGERDEAEVARAKAVLQARLELDGLQPAGPFRLLGYNSPMVPASRRFWELQVPVLAAARAEGPTPPPR